MREECNLPEGPGGNDGAFVQSTHKQVPDHPVLRSARASVDIFFFF